MKKVIIVAASLLLFSTIVTSCKSHGNCAGMSSSIEKADSSSRSI